MKLAIIGSGWVGCHLANVFKDDHEVVLFDKDGFFSGSSWSNQNRLHLGFHYARNSQTRELCRKTFERFRLHYAEAVVPVSRNIYAIPERDSLLDFVTYMSIFDHESYSYNVVEIPELVGIEGAIDVPEMRIDPFAAKFMFERSLGGIFVRSNIDSENILELLSKFDLVVNCTNNVFCPIHDESFYEVALMLRYKKVRQTSFEALTLVDGRLFSIFPSNDGLYNLSSVQHTPAVIVERPDEIEASLRTMDIGRSVVDFEKVVERHYPEFKMDFQYDGFVTSIKSKFKSESSNRNPVIRQRGNLVSCYTGKIQGIYMIEDYVREELCSRRK